MNHLARVSDGLISIIQIRSPHALGREFQQLNRDLTIGQLVRTCLLFAVLLTAFAFSTSAADAVTIETVRVGNPGNAPDTRYDPSGVGSVPYAYRMGKYEITAGQYTEFLNAVAKEDSNGLYEITMDSIYGPGPNIIQTGSSPNFVYTVPVDYANRPVTHVNMWDTIRFANWLHNGQPTGVQGPATTENGAYNLVALEGLSVFDLLFWEPVRNAGARFFIPTVDEWYKAAYHKNDGATGNYWDYPTASNIVPGNTLPDPANHANFSDGTGFDGYTIGPPYYRTEVGAFANSASPYGTFDQGGNVFELILPTGSSSPEAHGGSYREVALALHASYYGGVDRWNVYGDVGFRVASIPEPASIPLIVAALLGLMMRRTKK